MKKLFFVLPLFLILSMCTSDDSEILDCSAVLCASNFSDLYLKIIDSESDENLLINETYTALDIVISGSETILFSIQEVLEERVLTLSDSTWEAGTYEYTLSIGDSHNFDLTLTLESTGGEGCCSNRIFLASFEIDGQVQKEDVGTLFILPVSK
ncbi:hypothetical protein N9Y48_03725 [Zobellia sp.]|nr:hypothetical protein [Zobellia sp.]